MIQAARQKLASLTARLAALKPNPDGDPNIKDIHPDDLTNPETFYPIIITYPDDKLCQSFSDAKGVVHLRNSDYRIYILNHKKDY